MVAGLNGGINANDIHARRNTSRDAFIKKVWGAIRICQIPFAAHLSSQLLVVVRHLMSSYGVMVEPPGDENLHFYEYLCAISVSVIVYPVRRLPITHASHTAYDELVPRFDTNIMQGRADAFLV